MQAEPPLFHAADFRETHKFEIRMNERQRVACNRRASLYRDSPKMRSARARSVERQRPSRNPVTSFVGQLGGPRSCAR